MSETLDRIASELGGHLKALGLTLATAESCTGGWVAKVVTDVPGSSAWFDRGYVTYSNEAKVEMLGVSAQTLDAEGAVSEAVVREMVLGALAHSRASVALAVSGIAGPDGGTEDKPVGTVWFAWALAGTGPAADAVQVQTQRLQFAGNREEVRHQSVRVGLSRLLETPDPGAADGCLNACSSPSGLGMRSVAALARLQGSLALQGARPTHPADLHLTLAFLGALPPERRACCEAAADLVQAAPFAIPLSRVGLWPRPRILWCGPAVTPPELLTLADGLAEALVPCGVPREARPYAAHITLARQARAEARAAAGMVFDLAGDGLRPGRQPARTTAALPGPAALGLLDPFRGRPVV